MRILRWPRKNRFTIMGSNLIIIEEWINMTPEQFVFWLSGYLTGGRDNDDDSVVADIKKTIKTVRMNVTQELYVGEINDD